MSTKKKKAGNTAGNTGAAAQHEPKAAKHSIGDEVTFTPTDAYSEVKKEFPGEKHLDAKIIDIDRESGLVDLKIERADNYPVYARQIDPKLIA